jgi:HD-GYP domain-containing protein (c-di-GMP phosphodiesterase class II)
MSDEPIRSAEGAPLEEPVPVSPEEPVTAKDDEPVTAGLEGEPSSDGATVPSDSGPLEDEQPESPASVAAIEGTVRYSQGQLRRSRELLARLSAVRRATRFYAIDHPVVGESVAAVLEVLNIYFSEGVDVHLGFFEGEVLLGEQLLAEESVLFDQLARDMNALGVGTLSFLRGVTEPEMRRATHLLGADRQGIDAAGGFNALLQRLSLGHIAVGSVRMIEREGQSSGELEEAQVSFGGAVSLVREIDRLLRLNKNVSAGKVKNVVRSLVDNVISNRYAMLQLTGLKNYDEYTFYHSANVAILSLSLGSMITDDYRFLSSLGVGALLHDIGKLSVGLDILNKPGALDPEEWSNVRLHPVHGAEMVVVLPGVDKAALVAILEHHMRHDGAGYPARFPPRRQHLASRIVAVADSYDAMTSRRSYSAARVQDKAMLQLMQSSGTSLDPALLRLFVRLMGVYPPRSVVRLSGGELAVVLRPNESDPVRPVVKVVATPAGDVIAPAEVDLLKAPQLSIVECVDPRHLNVDVDAFFT